MGGEAKIAGTTHLKHRPPLTRPEVEISDSHLVRSASFGIAKQSIEKKDGEKSHAAFEPMRSRLWVRAVGAPADGKGLP